MKKLISVLLIAAAVMGLPIAAHADYDSQRDYMGEMLNAAMLGDIDRGVWAAECRDEKIDALGLDYVKVDFHELYLLAKIIQAEAGSEWLSDEWKMCVGEVVLNRVASPEFPNTILEVLEQPGQYYGRGSSYFASLLPSERCVNAAKRLLEGQRVMGEAAVVFQSNYVLGSGVYLELCDSLLGSTYFCLSSHPELYGA